MTTSARKRIGIDCRFAGTKTGLGRYTRELVTHLLSRDDAVEYVLFVRNAGEKWIVDMDHNHFSVVVAECPHYSLKEQFELPKKIKRARLDLFFSPHFNVPLRCPVPFIVTIHDLILHRYPNNASFLKRLAYKWVMGHAVKKAEKVIAVSDFTKRELLDVYGDQLESKITRIYEGVDPQFHHRSEEERSSVCEKYSLHKPFYLYVGNAKEHKNVQMLIDAYKKLDDSSVELVLVTGGKEKRKLRTVPGVIFLSGVPDEDLPILYSAARSFITPSLYEGFGLPVAEAIACECPVIASNKASIPEVSGDETALVSPTLENFVSGMRSPPLPSTKQSNFSWQKAAEETATVLLDGSHQ